MNIPGAFSNLSQSFRDYCYITQQASMAIVLKVRGLRNDPDFFQKVCQVAFASLQLIMLNYPGTGYLNRVATAFYFTAGMHDFYRFIQQPRQWFFPVDASSINEFALLDDMTQFVYKQIGPEEVQDFTSDDILIDEFEEINDVSSDAKIEKEELRKLLQGCLTAQLDQMSAKNDAYRNINELMKVLQARLHKFSDEDFDKYKFSTITLVGLQETDLSELNEENDEYDVSRWIRHVPLIEKIVNLNWAIVDLGCVTWLMQEWRLLDTEKLSDRIGQYRCFQWVKNYRLGSWVIGLVCTAFAWKILESVRKLRDETLTSQEKYQANWDVFLSLVELVYFGAIYLNHIGKTQTNNAYIHMLAIGAKSLGLIRIATRPKYEYFEKA